MRECRDPHSCEIFRVHAEAHRVRFASVRLPDRPPPKRPPLGEPSTSGAPSSVQLGDYGQASRSSRASETRISLFAKFSLQSEHTCVKSLMLYIIGTMDSPSRWRFRPPNRRAFRFRVRPLGSASTYSRSVLGAGANLLRPPSCLNPADDEKAALCMARAGRRGQGPNGPAAEPDPAP